MHHEHRRKSRHARRHNIHFHHHHRDGGHHIHEGWWDYIKKDIHNDWKRFDKFADDTVHYVWNNHERLAREAARHYVGYKEHGWRHFANEAYRHFSSQ